MMILSFAKVVTNRSVTHAVEEIYTTTVERVKVVIFIPKDVEMLRGLLVHAANYPMKPEDRWADLSPQMRFGQPMETGEVSIA
jgi:hypothetical protein